MNKEMIKRTWGEVVDLLQENFQVDLSLSMKPKKESLDSRATKILAYSSNIEAYLRQNWDAKGKGTTAKIKSIRHFLKSEDEDLMLYIAAQRNIAVHVGVDRIDFDEFESAYNQLVENIPKHYPKTVWAY